MMETPFMRPMHANDHHRYQQHPISTPMFIVFSCPHFSTKFESLARIPGLTSHIPTCTPRLASVSQHPTRTSAFHRQRVSHPSSTTTKFDPHLGVPRVDRSASSHIGYRYGASRHWCRNVVLGVQLLRSMLVGRRIGRLRGWDEGGFRSACVVCSLLLRLLGVLINV